MAAFIPSFHQRFPLSHGSELNSRYVHGMGFRALNCRLINQDAGLPCRGTERLDLQAWGMQHKSQAIALWSCFSAGRPVRSNSSSADPFEFKPAGGPKKQTPRSSARKCLGCLILPLF